MFGNRQRGIAARLTCGLLPGAVFLVFWIGPSSIGFSAAEAQRMPECDPSWKPPPKGTKQLFKEIRSSRDWNGGLIFSGKSLAPPDLVVTAILSRGGKVLGQDDFFSAPLFKAGDFIDQDRSWSTGRPAWPAGIYRLRLFSDESDLAKSECYFPKQLQELPFSATKPAKSNSSKLWARSIDQIYIVKVPEMTPQLRVIMAVEEAVLMPSKTSDRDPPSAVGDIVHSYEEDSAIGVVDWVAEKDRDGSWLVGLNFSDNFSEGVQKKAQWKLAVDGKTVTWLDPEAKRLSLVPDRDPLPVP